MLEQWVVDLLQKKLDTKELQNPLLDNNQAIQIIAEKYKTGQIQMIGSKEKNILVMFTPKTPYVTEIDIVADCKNAFVLYRYLKNAIEWGWKNTEFWKLTMSTHQEKIRWLAEKLGWEHEGTGLEEHLDFDQGRFVPVYYYGLVRPEKYKTEEYLKWAVSLKA